MKHKQHQDVRQISQTRCSFRQTWASVAQQEWMKRTTTAFTSEQLNLFPGKSQPRQNNSVIGHQGYDRILSWALYTCQQSNISITMKTTAKTQSDLMFSGAYHCVAMNESLPGSYPAPCSVPLCGTFLRIRHWLRLNFFLKGDVNLNF